MKLMTQAGNALNSMFVLTAFGILSTGSICSGPAALAADSSEKDKTLIAKAPAAAAKKVVWPTTIPWQSDYKTTLQYGKMHNKPVLITMTTKGCTECAKLDQQCYNNPAIINFINRNFICMKADGEKGPGTGVKYQYGVEVYPTVLIVDAESGKERGRLTGFYPPNAFPDELKRILARRY
jgi:hypothetical protein